MPYPFDPKTFFEVGEPDPRSDIVLVVGRIEHRKGQDVLVEAVADLPRQASMRRLYLPANQRAQWTG